MKKLLRKISISRKYFILPLLILVVAVILFPKTVNADIIDLAANLGKTVLASPILIALGVISLLVMGIFGALDMMVISFITNIVQYNNFINEPTIVDAWVIVRDLCNMFFILILLVVAFATILRIESYQWKKILPKLLIMAVLINFSRTICGLIIDASQVIMMTFTNAFGSGGEFISLTKMSSYFTGTTFNSFTTKDWSVLNVVIGLLIGIMFMIISGIVLVVAMSVFLMRIVMLWIYIVLSPLAFLAAAFPAGQKYATQWWSEFIKYIINGPVLAFFIWMALMTSRADFKYFNFSALKGQCFGNSAIMCMDQFMPFVMSIGMMIGGLIITQQIGGVGASIAGKGLDWAKKATQLVAKGAVAPTKLGASFLNDKLQQKGIVDLNLVRAWGNLQASRKDKKSRMYAEGVKAADTRMSQTGGRFSGLMAATATPGDAWDHVSSNFNIMHPFSSKGVKQRLMGGKRVAEEKERLSPELEQAKFEAEYTSLSKEDRGKKFDQLIENKDNKRQKLVDLTNESYKYDEMIDEESDPEGKKELQDKQKKIMDEIESVKKASELLNPKLKFAEENQYKNFTNSDVGKFRRNVDKKQKEFNEYIPMYSFESKAAEEKAVGAEMDKIKKVDDQQELVRMLKEAIQAGEKSRIKAIIRKLTSDYNDNEAFAALVPEAGTGYQGLQALMDGLSTKGDRNYAGFDKQEAYALGAQVAEMNKKTNHWEAAAAYIMDNGQWRKADAREHAMIASTEFGKRAPRANAREFNRLAMGKHILNPNTGKMEYNLTDIGLIALQSWDNSTSIDRMLEDMTESNAKFLLPFLSKLESKGFFKAKGEKQITLLDGRKDQPTLADMIRLKANEATEDFTPQFNKVTEIKRSLYSEE